MHSLNSKVCGFFTILVLLTVSTVSGWAGSAVVGSVAGSLNATLGGQSLVPNTTVFSGDSLQVKDGAAVVALGQGSRLVFGRETVASFLREAGEVTVLLGQGNVSLFHPESGTGLRVKVGQVSILPAAGYKTLGEVAMLNGALVVTAKEGKLRVESSGRAEEVMKGKTLTLPTQTARSPQAAGPGAAVMSTSTALQVGSAAAGATSAVLSGVAISRASDAKTSSAAAQAAAQTAATNAANAQAAATAAGNTANSVGCALNAIAPAGASPYTPPSDKTCP